MDDIVKINDFDLGKILLDEKPYDNGLIYQLAYDGRHL